MKIQRALALLLITGLLLAASQPILANGNGKSTGELIPSGSVTVNGTTVSTSVTVVSDSRITTLGNSGAQANLAGTGQLFIGESTDIMLTFEHNMINIQLYTGSVRIKTPFQSLAIVTTNTCATVESINGLVKVLAGGRSNSPDMLNTGESKEFRDRTGLSSNAEQPVDYRVSTINCDTVVAVPFLPSHVTLYSALVGGAAAAVAGGIIGTRSGDKPVTTPVGSLSETRP